MKRFVPKPISHGLELRSTARATAALWPAPNRQIKVLNDSSAGYAFKVLDCSMKKADQQKQLNNSISVPTSQWLWFSPPLLPCWFLPLFQIKSMMGPLYRIMSSAPITVTRVPKTFAWLRRFFRLIFSILVLFESIGMSVTIYVRLRTSIMYLKISPEDDSIDESHGRQDVVEGRGETR